MRLTRSHLPTPVSIAILVPSEHISKQFQLKSPPSASRCERQVFWCVVFSLLSVKILIITSILGKNIRKLVKDRLIMRRQTTMHSRSRAKAWAEQKRKGKLLDIKALPLLKAYACIGLFLIILIRSPLRKRSQKGSKKRPYASVNPLDEKISCPS